jgi:phage gpG-like protein
MAVSVGTAVDADFGELAGVIASFEKRGKNLGRMMPQVAEALKSAVDDVYEAEGPNWEPLLAATMERRRGTTAKILQDTGVMAASTMTKYGQAYAEAWAHVGYAKYHASGSKDGTLPQRNPFDLGPFELPLLEEIADMLVEEAIK